MSSSTITPQPVALQAPVPVRSVRFADDSSSLEGNMNKINKADNTKALAPQYPQRDLTNGQQASAQEVQQVHAENIEEDRILENIAGVEHYFGDLVAHLAAQRRDPMTEDLPHGDKIHLKCLGDEFLPEATLKKLRQCPGLDCTRALEAEVQRLSECEPVSIYDPDSREAAYILALRNDPRDSLPVSAFAYL
ncbi:hypothetical protein MD484_g7531, partial [Candolleomyces efflorescens]